MTGTASTEADEFAEIYKLDVLEMPTNRPVQRIDEDDEVYRTGREKLDAIAREIEEANAKMQPLLVGTTSIEKSEQLAEFLLAKGYKQIDFSEPTKALGKLYEAARSGTPSRQFAVLNARFHEQEAYIVAEAGVPGAITIATNMAGRGTDIQLGGNIEMRVAQEMIAGLERRARDAKEAEIRAEVAAFKEKALAAGGLYIIGTERHESRRIDNQLRGRSGRQGDPGRSKFFLSLQDDLMRIFGSERMEAMLKRLGLQGGRGDRPSVDQQGAGEGAAEGRGAQLRHPQEHPEIRQCDERPAQGHFRAPARDHGGGIARGDRRGDARGA